uniref:Uncharacterized protein n=1 Tax=Anguilla anguilla TaxID=7936 RepID=A0A0E9UD97_ANGAN
MAFNSDMLTEGAEKSQPMKPGQIQSCHNDSDSSDLQITVQKHTAFSSDLWT